MTDAAEQAKEYLQKIERLRIHARAVSIETTDQMIEAFEFLAAHSASYSDTRSRSLNRIRELQEYRKEQERERAGYLAQADAIGAEVDAMPDAIDRAILYQHYVSGESFDTIADAIGYSTRQAIRIHEQALERFWREHENK